MDYEIFDMENYKFITIPKLNNMGLKNIYTLKPMNLSFNLAKDPKTVRDSIDYCLDIMGISQKTLFTSYQVHGNRIQIVNEADEGEIYKYARIFFDTDGLITSNPELVIYSKFADCTPVLLFDPINMVHANLHSGWKGTLKKIGENGVKMLQKEFNSNPGDIIAIVGPTIGYDDFEVDEDVAIQFRKTFPFYSEIMKWDGKKYKIDLLETNKRILRQCGVKDENIIDIPLSTYSTPYMHSYRRDKKNYGLMGLITSMDE